MTALSFTVYTFITFGTDNLHYRFRTPQDSVHVVLASAGQEIIGSLNYHFCGLAFLIIGIVKHWLQILLSPPFPTDSNAILTIVILREIG